MDSNTPFKRNIKNIVYVMFENRSFDNLLGWLYDGDANPCHVHNIPANPDPKPKFMGLTPELLQEFKQPLKGLLNIRSTTYHPIVRGVQGNFLPSSTPIADPHEKFQYITQQIYQTPLNHAPTKKDKRTMLGFLQNYHDAHPLLGIGISHEILQTYDFDQAPVINSLAYNYGVSDEWFCSIPSQTSINRAYSLIGNSIGYKAGQDADLTAMVNNSDLGLLHGKRPSQFTGDTIWNVLSSCGYSTDKDWKIYYSDHYLNGYLGDRTSYTYLMFKQLQTLLNPTGAESFTDPRFQKIDCFYDDAKQGRLPRFSYIEPKYTWEEFAGIGIHGDDYHPPSDINKGEAVLAKIYNSLINSPQWNETLLIVAFDEHGGTFDHIPPPECAVPPSGKHINECNFDFERYGVRVPMLFISPWVVTNTVIRSQQSKKHFDHTSWLASLLHWFDLEPALLGDRTAVAPMFDDVISDTKRGTFELPCFAEIVPDSDQEDKELTVDLAEKMSLYVKAANPDLDRKVVLKRILTECDTEKEMYNLVRGILS